MIIKKYSEFSQDINDFIVQKYVDGTTESFLEDVSIWHNKVRVDNPVLCSGDGPINRLRQWYQQFLIDRDQLPVHDVEKKEYVSLSHA